MGRRAESTEYLKDCITGALVELMREKSIGRIRVQEIADLAKVGRVTYFRHFHSHEDVLEYKLLRLWAQWTKDNDSAYDHALWFFSFCVSIQELLKLLHLQNQYGSTISAYIAFTEPVAADADAPARYKRRFFSYGIHGLVTEWLRGGCQETPETFAAMCAI